MSYDCYCDYDSPEVYNATTPKARKQYRCDECSSPILPGEKYERVFLVHEGDPGTYITCERCYDLRQWVKNNVPCFCWAHGSMHDDAREAVEEARYRARDETRGLKFGLLRRFIAIDRARKERRKAVN